jgi:fructose-1,6-bisphosphatase I/sedoheptulose-1,7-bisphosphatase
MLNPGYTTISKFLIQQVPEGPHSRALAALLVDVAAVIKAVSAAVGKGPLSGMSGLAGTENAQGEAQKKLDIVSDELFVRGIEWSGLVGALASEEMTDVRFVAGPGRLALVFDPLDGSSNIDVNVAVGSIFSVLALPEGATDGSAVLQPGLGQLAAGYAIYGPSTQLILTVGTGTHGFTLDREIGNFVLTHPDIRIPEETSEYSINASNRRFWEPPIARYVDECKAGKEGPRGRDFNTRWVASLVADVHRVLRNLPVSARPEGSQPTGPVAPDVRGEPDGDARRAGRWCGVDGPRTHPRGGAGAIAPARSRGPRFPSRGLSRRALPRRI